MAMDIASVALTATLMAFVACLVAIAFYDVCSFTIPNGISIVLIWLFLVTLPLVRADISVASHVGSFLLVAIVGLLAFRFGVFGGGDVKSWAAVALWYDLADLPFQVVSVALIGGMFGLLTLTVRRAVASTLVRQYFAPLRLPRFFHVGEPVPYGVAIALGTVLSFEHIDLFKSL